MKRIEIEQLLPEILRRTASGLNPLKEILDVMEHLHAPSEVILERLASIFNPYETRADVVPYLASWLDLERFFDESKNDGAVIADESITTGSGRLRELIARAAYLSQWRGTARGLIAFLETATGTTGFIIDEHVMKENKKPRPFHVRIRVPECLKLHRALIIRIIESEKPAYVTYEFEWYSEENARAPSI